MAPRAGNDEPQNVLYGFHAVIEALQSASRSINRLWLARTDGRFSPLSHLARQRHIPFSVETKDRLDRLAGSPQHQGIVASVAPKQFLHGEELLDQVETLRTPALLIVLDQIQDPHNLGAIIRTVDGAGGHGIVIPKHRAVGLTAAVGKASAGALEHVSIARLANTGKFIDQCRGRNILALALDAQAEASYTDVDLTGPLVLVFGSEGKGIRPLVQKKCDSSIQIPLSGNLGSLNVATAVAITLFEAIRQRKMKGEESWGEVT